MSINVVGREDQNGGHRTPLLFNRKDKIQHLSYKYEGLTKNNICMPVWLVAGNFREALVSSDLLNLEDCSKFSNDCFLLHRSNLMIMLCACAIMSNFFCRKSLHALPIYDRTSGEEGNTLL